MRRAGPSGPTLAVVCGVSAEPLPSWLISTLTTAGLSLTPALDRDAAIDVVRRARPAVIIADLRGAAEPVMNANIERFKADAVMAVVPFVALTDGDHTMDLLRAGADEAVASTVDPALGAARVTAVLRRSARDLAAQPTTRLPASVAIDAEIERRIAAGAPFAACYADLDHFKEFNDRYGFREGDRVIRMTARVLHDAAVGLAGADAFVGHIGGDDFVLVLPLEQAKPVCELAIEVFDTLVPLQYSEADRRAGYYFGKDRRGHLHRVPLMTLSIGAATNERRPLRSAAEVSRLVSEMKSFAKAKAGSVYAVDRRVDDELPRPASGQPNHLPVGQ